MTAQWKNGLTTFFVVLAIGLVARLAVLWLIRQDESHFADPEALGVVLMVAAFAGLGAGARK